VDGQYAVPESVSEALECPSDDLMSTLCADRLRARSAAAGRECEDCAACCIVPAVHELNKPARWSCDNLSCHGCRIYDSRPASCRDFNCLWLRGALADDPMLRPDRLGVMFDWFQSLKAGRERLMAFELWNGAFDGPQAAELLRNIATECEVDLSYRDGTWRTIGTRAAISQSASAVDSVSIRENRAIGNALAESDRI
jgi:hypothetical protein